MDIHEYQTKSLLKAKGILTPDEEIAFSLDDVEAILEKKGWDSAILKIQIHAGGRGKMGGVKMEKTRQGILKTAKELIGKRFINHQTGPQGMVAEKILVCSPVDIVQEYYLAVATDRKLAKNILIASPVGGMDIEEVSKNDPSKVLALPVPERGAFYSYQITHLCKFMGWDKDLAIQGELIVKALIALFFEIDATLLEINPLVKTKEGKLVALDAKLSIDDNALYRQPLIKQMFDPSQVPIGEVKAQQQELSYVSLEGDIGCMVNGAGLAMATMDMIDHFGGKPANFLDVGGSATKEKVAEGFKIILSDPNVKVIFINIFGGIMNCKTLAGGVIEAAKEVAIRVPLVLRMEGTEVEGGKELIRNAGLNILLMADMAAAAKKAVELGKRVG